ncbi:MAG: hypothetical protein ACI8ZO_001119 [Flavobacteriales bacterium]|jgi:hypothetical protein
MKNIKFCCALIFLSGLLSSCDNSNLFLNVNFNYLSKNEEIQKLIEKGEIYYEIDNNDTTYYKHININGVAYKVKVKFNPQIINSGPIISYVYDFATIEFRNTGNDTGEGYFNNHEVFPYSKFYVLKEFLDDKLNYGIPKTPVNSVYDTSYSYFTEKYDIELERGLDWYEPSIKYPVYQEANLYFYSKDFNMRFEQAKKRRKNTITPPEVVSIKFAPPKYVYDYSSEFKKDYYGHNPAPTRISFKANSHNYNFISGVLFKSDIIECRGVLAVLDNFNDTIFKESLDYHFIKPLEADISSTVEIIRESDFNEYSINNPKYVWTEMAKTKKQLKTVFTPTAIVFRNGEVLR